MKKEALEKLVQKLKDSPEKNVDLYVDSLEEMADYSAYDRKDRRILNSSVAEYLEKCAKEITIKNSITIRLHIANGQDSDYEDAENLIHEYYREKTERELAERKNRTKKWNLRLLLGLLFLAMCHGIGFVCLLFIKNHSLAELLQDSCEIAGWVGLWEPVLYFLYTRKDETLELSDFIQLQYSKIVKFE